MVSPRYDRYGGYARKRTSPMLGLLLAVGVLGAAAYFVTQGLEAEDRSCGSALSPDDGFEIIVPEPTGGVATAADPVALGQEDSPCDDRIEERWVHVGVGLVLGLSTALGVGSGVWLLKGGGGGYDSGGGGGDGGGD